MAEMAAPVELELVADPNPAAAAAEYSEKRTREDEEEADKNGAKRAKIIECVVDEMEESGIDGGVINIGPKKFGTSVEMFDYFFKILHSWTTDLNLNQYEHNVLLELLKRGHLEADRKIGKGIKAFQVRFHPQFKSRCFFLVRDDESVDDFSFRKCVDHILPLPENMQVKHDFNKAFHGKGSGRGRGRSRGRGRGHGRGHR